MSSLPKSDKSEEWIKAADKKREEIMKRAGRKNLLGQPKLKVGSPLHKAMSDKEVLLRREGMKRRRKERGYKSAPKR